MEEVVGLRSSRHNPLWLWGGLRNFDHGGRLVTDRAIPGRSARHSSRRSVKGRAPAKGEGGDGWARHHEFMMRERPHRAPNACVLPQGRSICSASRRGASLEWERLLPPGQACPPHCKRVSCDGVRCMQPPVRRAAVVLRLTLNNAPPSPWSPLKGGHQRFARATRVFPFLFTILGLIG